MNSDLINKFLAHLSVTAHNLREDAAHMGSYPDSLTQSLTNQVEVYYDDVNKKYGSMEKSQ